jgi:hypothetical protein
MSEEKVPTEVLVQRILETPHVGRKYRHYKTGGLYRVVDGCIIESTQQAAVVYQPIDGSGIRFCRPLSEWNEAVEYKGRTVPRFKEV